MERTVDVNERIRRAEELYNRRKMQGGVRVSTSNVNNSSRNSFSLFKKLAIKLIVCAIIYLIFYILKNSGMIFSKDIINQTKHIISYDVDFSKVYVQAVKIFNENIVANVEKNNKKGENTEQNNENQENSNESKVSQIQNELLMSELSLEEENINSLLFEKLGVGGTDSSDEVSNVLNAQPEQTSESQKSQMEIDAEYVKSNFSLKIPVQGIVTSRFGPRKPTKIVTANHKGIDIGANTGTKIYAAMEGTVVNVSTVGDYGKHFSIKNGDVVTLYAHCSKINVSAGQYVKQGQEIAKVGSTGRTTGSHLHFEIQRDGRAINPELILDFN